MIQLIIILFILYLILDTIENKIWNIVEYLYKKIVYTMEHTVKDYQQEEKELKMFFILYIVLMVGRLVVSGFVLWYIYIGIRNYLHSREIH